MKYFKIVLREKKDADTRYPDTRNVFVRIDDDLAAPHSVLVRISDAISDHWEAADCLKYSEISSVHQVDSSECPLVIDA